MKFSMNRALTIGTLDGANAEIREEIGVENFFLFGFTEEEMERRKREGYNTQDIIAANDGLSEMIQLMGNGLFPGGNRGLFLPLTLTLRGYDENMLCADYPQIFTYGP